MTGITGSMVSFDNIQWDVNTGKAYDSNITVYHPAEKTPPVLKQGDSVEYPDGRLVLTAPIR